VQSGNQIESDGQLPVRYKPIVRLPDEVANPTGGVGLNAYQRVTLQTDNLNQPGLEAPILGIFGEVGSLLSALKKKQRDKAAFDKYDDAILEELGDVIWYFTNLASRSGLDLSILAQRTVRDMSDWDDVGSDEFGTFGDIQSYQDTPITPDEFGNRVIDLAGHVGDLVKDFRRGAFTSNRDKLSAHLVEVFRALVAAADAAQVSLDNAARGNLLKIFSRWPIDKTIYPPRIDAEMPKNERFPLKLSIFIEEHTNGSNSFVIQKCNGIIVGDRLTDNKTEHDDYRFHDVFHVAFAVHLGWSPVLRALFHLKRKSKPEIDENQDGARAILLEEGAATFIFGRGLERDLMDGLDHVDYDLLKSIQELVRGYEVERCALWQWEKAILDGFKVFRAVKKARRGYIVADLDGHTINFEEGEDNA
jgi:NTP pyrophosphatase (non-canonical NTP hydrolase)